MTKLIQLVIIIQIIFLGSAGVMANDSDTPDIKKNENVKSDIPVTENNDENQKIDKIDSENKDTVESEDNKKADEIIVDNETKNNKNLDEKNIPIDKNNSDNSENNETNEKSETSDDKILVSAGAEAYIPVEEKKNESVESGKIGYFNLLKGNSFFIGMGQFNPVSDYSGYYDSAYVFSARASVNTIQYKGFFPELSLRYYSMDSKARADRYNSSMTLTQVLPGVSYRYSFNLPSLFNKYLHMNKPAVFYGRIADGLTRVSYESSGPNGSVVEIINTFEMGAGAVYPVLNNFEVGLDFGYSYVFTAGSALQGLTAMLVMGYRM